MKIAILGAGGCFGNNLADYFSKPGYEVIGIGRSPRKPECFSLGVSYPYYNYHITYENDYVMKVLDDFEPEIIVNFAAQGEGAASFNPDDYWRFYETNCVGLAKLTGQLQKRKYLKKFVHIGTSELYGSVTKPSSEESPILASSPYSASKAAFDLHLMSISKAMKFPMNIIRPSNCYVEGQQLHRIIPKAILCALSGVKLPLHGGGLAKKSYLYSADLNKAIEIVMNNADIGEVYNCGPDEPTSIKEVVERCANIIGTTLEKLADITPDRLGQDSIYWLDSSKLKKLGWSQSVMWDEGLAIMHGWIEKYLPQLSALPTNYTMRA